MRPPEHDVSEVMMPVRVSLSWLREQKSVPVCGGNWRDECRVTQSLSLRAESAPQPDGSIRILIPPGYWVVQFLAVIAAGIGIVAAVFVPVVMILESRAGLVPVFIVGGVLGALAARWVIRKHPAVLLTWQPSEGCLIADNGNLRFAHTDIARLILVTGKGVITLPDYPVVTAQHTVFCCCSAGSLPQTKRR